MGKIKRTLGFILDHPIGKRHRLKSLIRFLYWQAQSRLSPSKYYVKKFISPVKFYVKKGQTGLTGNIYTGLHEFYDMAFLLHFLRDEDVFFDVGANAGSYTLLASGVSKARSITIEPVPATFDILTKNITLNNLTNKVTLINAAAGAAKGMVAFSTNEDTTNHVIAQDEITAVNTVNVPIITVDAVAEGQQPALIKIDVEGFETEVLKGMKTTLDGAELKSIIIELNGSGGRYGFDEKKIHQLLLEKKFIPYSYNPHLRVLTEAESYGSYNTIYCRDLTVINERLKNAAKFNIMGELI